MTTDELRSSVVSGSPVDLKNPGKIYLKDEYLFINEINKGLHIIDNSDPGSPQNIAFITIPGNVDIAIKGEILYADNAVDLIAIDITNINDIKVVKRIENVFPFNYKYGSDSLVLVEYKEEKITETYVEDCGGGGLPSPWFKSDSDIIMFNSTGDNPNSGPKAGTGGSMARFTIYDNYLYTVSNSDLQLFDITVLSDPVSLNNINIGWNIETIYPYQDKLFIGSQTGMYIYDNSTPSEPTYMSQFAHVSSCDPVVAYGNFAYVTLRSGNACQGYTNQLDVIDITDLYNPKLTVSYDMENPHGLGITNNILFICDGAAGLKIYDATDPFKIDKNQIAHFKGMDTYDVIPLNDVVMMIGQDGLYQYDYNNLDNLKLLSVIPVVK